jgi:uncharacterized membrane protein
VPVAEGFLSDFKRFFIRGLAAFLPTLLTIVLLLGAFSLLDKWFGASLRGGVRWTVERIWRHYGSAPAWVSGQESWDKRFWWVGFVLFLVGIYFFGRFVASLIGRSIWRNVEQAILRLPVVKQVYPYVKQVTEFFLSEKKRLDFSRVVAVEYPRKGIWSMGLVTGPAMCTIGGAVLDSDALTVFIPSSPTPVTGYVVAVNRGEVIDLPITIDEAIRFVVSCGVIIPPSQLLELTRAVEPLQLAASAALSKEVPK